MAHNPPGGRPGQNKAYEANQPAPSNSSVPGPRTAPPDYAHRDYVTQPPNYGPPPTYGYAPHHGGSVPPAYGFALSVIPPLGADTSSFPPHVGSAPYRQMGCSDPRSGTQHQSPYMGPGSQQKIPPQGVPQAMGYGPPVQPYGPPVQPHGPPVQPYGPPVQPHGPPVQPYGPPVQPYGPPVQPYGPPVQPHGSCGYGVPGASFNAGARFDAVAPASIPPPAPGYAPSEAQQAAMQGHAVAPTQQQSNYFTTGAGGQVKML